MRTQKEIVDKMIEEGKAAGLSGLWWEFQGKEYVVFLTWESFTKVVKGLPNVFKPEILTKKKIKKDWTVTPLTKEHILKQMQGYLPFAFEKAEGQRGISANRSIEHYLVWIWLLGDEKFYAKIQKEYNTNYHSYGIPILKKIQRHYQLKRRDE